jgi:hypothetical protein
MSRPQAPEWSDLELEHFAQLIQRVEGALRRVPRTARSMEAATATGSRLVGPAAHRAGTPTEGAERSPLPPDETRECENCGQHKPVEEMETVFLPGTGESYQCEACRGGP